MKPMTTLPKHQSGSVAVMVALTIFVLIAFLGMTVDLGRLFITKTELSNASDACALAAAAELNGASDSLDRAVSAGITVGQRNKVGFQGSAVTILEGDITFSANLNGTYDNKNAATPANMKYAKCTLPQTGILPYFMQVVGFGPQTVTSHAVATLAPGITNCGLPIGICDASATVTSCADGSAPEYGHCKHDWVCSVFTKPNPGNKPNDPDEEDEEYKSIACPNSVNPTGNFNLIDYCPPQSTCIKDGIGGAPAMTDLLAGSGQCGLDINWKVGATGLKFGPMQAAWNTRFGITPPQGQIANGFTPDYTGFAYTPTSWPSQKNAFAGTSVNGAPHFANLQGDTSATSARKANLPYQDDQGTWPDGFTVLGNLNIVTGSADRRIAVVPIMDCAGWEKSQVADIKAFACILMLHPWADKWTGPDPNKPPLYLEYLGLSTDPGSPCASTGLPGGPGSVGPMVPTLVR